MNERARIVTGNSQVWYEIMRLKQAGVISKGVYDIIYDEKEQADDNMVSLIINVVNKNHQLVQRNIELKSEINALNEQLENKEVTPEEPLKEIKDIDLTGFALTSDGIKPEGKVTYEGQSTAEEEFNILMKLPTEEVKQ